MTDKVEQALFFPRAMVEHIQREAFRLDRSLSWVVQKAWSVGRGGVLGLDAGAENPIARARKDERYGGEDAKVRQTLFFPSEMLEEMRAEAARQDRSVSWLVEQAWCLALESIEALPSS